MQVVAFSWSFSAIRIGAIDIHATRHWASIISTILISPRWKSSSDSLRKPFRLISRKSRHRRTPRKSTMNAPVLFFSIVMQFWTLAFALPLIQLHNHTHLIGHSSSLSVDDSRCFDPAAGMQHIKPQDCQGALAKVFHLPDVMKEKKWSVPETHDHIFGTWDYGTCSIDLIAFTQLAEDTFSSLTVALEAVQVIDYCVKRRTQLGGRRLVGPKKQFEVVVWFRTHPGSESLAVT